MTHPNSQLSELRQVVARIDSQILELMAQRFETVNHIGKMKKQLGEPIRNRRVEHAQQCDYLAQAKTLGVAPSFARKWLRLLVKESRRLQRRQRRSR